MTKKTNPFVKVTTVNEFFKLLRADLERIRGRKFRYWKVSGVRLDLVGGEDWLSFNIEASNTRVGDDDWKDDYTWSDLADGRCQHCAPKGSLLSQWTGYGYDFFRGGCGGGGSQTGTSHRWSSIDLKYLPNIRKMLKANRKIEAKRLLLTEHPDYKRLEAEAVEARRKVVARLEELWSAFDTAHPETNLMTGVKEVRWRP